MDLLVWAYGCFLVAALVLVVGGIAVASHHRPPTLWLYLLIVLVIADVVLTIPVAIHSCLLEGDAIGFEPGWVVKVIGTTLFDVMAMMVFESQMDAFESFAAALGSDGALLGNVYVGLAQVLYILTFVMVAMSAYSLLSRRLERLQIRHRVRMAHHNGALVYIFQEADARSLAFARQLYSDEEKARRASGRRPPLGSQDAGESASQASLPLGGWFGRRPRRDRSRLCIFTGVSDSERKVVSGDIERFGGENVSFTDMDVLELVEYLDRSFIWNKPGQIANWRNLNFFFFADDESANLSGTLRLVERMAQLVPLDGGSPDEGMLETLRLAAGGHPRGAQAPNAELTEEERRLPQSEQESIERTRKSELAEWTARESFADDVVGMARACYASRGRFYGGQPRYHVFCACSGECDEIALDSIPDSEGFDVRVVDECREVVYDLLWRHPLQSVLAYSPGELMARQLAGEDKIPLAVIIVGCGHYGREAIRAAAWLGQIVGVRLSLYVIDQVSPREFEESFSYDTPDLYGSDLFDLYYCQGDVTRGGLERSLGLVVGGGAERLPGLVERSGGGLLPSPGISPRTIPYCIVSLGDEEHNTEVAIKLRRYFYGDGQQPVVEPDIYVDIYDEKRHGVVKNLRAADSKGGLPFSFEPFGGIAHIFNERHLVFSDMHALAFTANACYSGKIDADYLRRVRDLDLRGLDVAEVPSAYELLMQSLHLGYGAWQMNRLSSMTNALGIKAKLWALGFDVPNDGEPADGGLRGLEERERAIERDDLQRRIQAMGDELDLMARVEHDRWLLFYAGEGWTGESADASKAFKNLGLSNGRHDSHLLMRHPYMCPFDDLAAVAAELGKSDPTVYDVSFVKDLSRILHDAAGFMWRRFVPRRIDTVEDALLRRGRVYEPTDSHGKSLASQGLPMEDGGLLLAVRAPEGVTRVAGQLVGEAWGPHVCADESGDHGEGAPDQGAVCDTIACPLVSPTRLPRPTSRDDLPKFEVGVAGGKPGRTLVPDLASMRLVSSRELEKGYHNVGNRRQGIS